MNQGTSITLWNPFVNRTGCTTISIALGIALSWYGHKRTFLTNLAQDKKLEQYVGNDINIRYTLDELKARGEDISFEDMQILSTKINDKLNCIGNYLLSSNIESQDDFFIKNCMDIWKENYDFTLTDLSNKTNDTVIENTDILLILAPFDKKFLDKMHEDSILSSYMKQPNTIIVFNNVFSSLSKEVDKVANEYGIENYICISSDVNVFYYSTIEHSLYTYITDNFNKKDPFISSILDLAFEILKISDKTLDIKNESFFSKLFKKSS